MHRSDVEYVGLLEDALALYSGNPVLERVKRLGRGALRPGMDVQEVTMLLTDIAAYTFPKSGCGPTEIVEWHRAYLAAIFDATLSNGGFIDSFLGESVISWFRRQDAVNACRAALSAKTAVENLIPLGKENWPKVHIGQSIHVGMCQVGADGTDKRLRFGILGDSLNFARAIWQASKSTSLYPPVLSKEAFLMLSSAIDAREESLSGYPPVYSLWGIRQSSV